MAQSTRQTKDAKSTKTSEQENEKQSVGQTDLTKKGEEISEKLDDLLDEIDELLEENADEFVKGYIQRGGQ
jgi:ubiquitin-like protein Pup